MSGWTLERWTWDEDAQGWEVDPERSETLDLADEDEREFRWDEECARARIRGERVRLLDPSGAEVSSWEPEADLWDDDGNEREPLVSRLGEVDLSSGLEAFWAPLSSVELGALSWGELSAVSSWDGSDPVRRGWREVEVLVHVVRLSSWGDYAGSTIERANERALSEMEGALSVSGGYESAAVALAPWERGEILESVRALADYPLVDEELRSELEMDLWEDAWESWAREELRSELERETETDLSEVSEDTLRSLLGELQEESGTYPEADGTEMYLDLEALVRGISRARVLALEGAVREEAEEEAQELERSSELAWIAQRASAGPALEESEDGDVRSLVLERARARDEELRALGWIRSDGAVSDAARILSEIGSERWSAELAPLRELAEAEVSRLEEIQRETSWEDREPIRAALVRMESALQLLERTAELGRSAGLPALWEVDPEEAQRRGEALGWDARRGISLEDARERDVLAELDRRARERDPERRRSRTVSLREAELSRIRAGEADADRIELDRLAQELGREGSWILLERPDGTRPRGDVDRVEIGETLQESWILAREVQGWGDERTLGPEERVPLSAELHRLRSIL